MKKSVTVSLFFAAFFAITLTSCNGPLDGNYRTIHLNGSGEKNGSGDLESANTYPPVVNTEYIIKELESKLAELIQALDGKADGESVTSELEVDGTTCTVTLRKGGGGYNVKMGGVDLRNEHALKSLLYGMQKGIPGSLPIDLDFSDCKGAYMPSIVGKPEVDKTRFVSVILPDTVKDLYHAPVVGGDDVRTFDGFTNLKKVSAPGVTKIRKKAFAYLENLEEVNIPHANSIGESAFNGCEKLATLTVKKEEITVIEDFTFTNCKSLTTIDFLNVTTIGSNAFEGCSGLTTIDFPNVTTIESSAFSGCSSLKSTPTEPLGINPQKITLLGNYAFSDCSRLQEVYFPQITSVPRGAFSGCTNLTGLKSDWALVQTIEDSAFSECGELVTVSFSAVTQIEDYAFENCSKLATVTIPAAASINFPGSIADAFRGCDSLDISLL